MTEDAYPSLAEPLASSVSYRQVYKWGPFVKSSAKCRNCGKAIQHNGSAIEPAWYHADSGRRVCGR